MKIEIKTKHGTWTTTPADIAAAEWEQVGETNRHYIDDEDGRLYIAEADGDGTWTGIETNALAAKDEAGNDVPLYFSAAAIWSEDGRDSYIAYPAAKRFTAAEDDSDYWGDEADVRTADKWGEWVGAEKWHEMAGMDLEGAPAIDYAAAAAEWIGENTDERTRFWVDDARGFANEWTLYIDPQGREEIMLSDLPDSLAIPPEADEPAKLREISAESAQGYICDAVQTKEDYNLEHGAMKCVGAVVL